MEFPRIPSITRNGHRRCRNVIRLGPSAEQPWIDEDDGDDVAEDAQHRPEQRLAQGQAGILLAGRNRGNDDADGQDRHEDEFRHGYRSSGSCALKPTKAIHSLSGWPGRGRLSTDPRAPMSTAERRVTGTLRMRSPWRNLSPACTPIAPRLPEVAARLPATWAAIEI